MAAGITLAEARERLHEAKRLIAAGKSPAKEKAKAKTKEKDAETFGGWAEKWLRGHQMAESTRDMRRSVYERELKPKFANRKMKEITDDDLRRLTDTIVARGAPATAVHVREVVMWVYRWANERGERVENPADLVRPSAIAKFSPKDRSLSPEEIGLMYEYLDRVGTGPSFRVACKLLLLTLVRKSELTEATWDEVNFTEAVWTIPKERMKRARPHNVYLSQQALDYFIALKTFAGGSRYVLPGRYDSDLPMSKATLNQVLTLTYTHAQKDGKPLGKFGPHDLRRTASTLLHEANYNTDWIEKCLAHEQKGCAPCTTRRSTLNSGAQCSRTGLTWWMGGPSSGLALILVEARWAHGFVRRLAARAHPCLHFVQVPGHVACGQRDALGEGAALFQVIDCPVAERHLCQQLLAVDVGGHGVSSCCAAGLIDAATQSRMRCQRRRPTTAGSMSTRTFRRWLSQRRMGPQISIHAQL